MGKITFRADDDLVDELESFDVSKSEVMREALRSYLGQPGTDPTASPGAGTAADARSGQDDRSATLDEMLEDRVDDVIEDRLSRAGATDVNLTITVDSGTADAEPTNAAVDAGSEGVPESIARLDHEGADAAERPCSQCGMTVDASHVYCPNCGEKTTGRVFCECGDEVRSDWAFCPSCGRRTPAADVLDSA